MTGSTRFHACAGCHAEPGQRHGEWCDNALCLVTGEQRIQCDENHDCGYHVWKGRWCGEEECEEYGFWCHKVLNPPGSRYEFRWERCSWEVEDAQPDLDRLMEEATWNGKLQRWVVVKNG